MACSGRGQVKMAEYDIANIGGIHPESKRLVDKKGNPINLDPDDSTGNLRLIRGQPHVRINDDERRQIRGVTFVSGEWCPWPQYAAQVLHTSPEYRIGQTGFSEDVARAGISYVPFKHPDKEAYFLGKEITVDDIVRDYFAGNKAKADEAKGIFFKDLTSQLINYLMENETIAFKRYRRRKTRSIAEIREHLSTKGINPDSLSDKQAYQFSFEDLDENQKEQVYNALEQNNPGKVQTLSDEFIVKVAYDLLALAKSSADRIAEYARKGIAQEHDENTGNLLAAELAAVNRIIVDGQIVTSTQKAVSYLVRFEKEVLDALGLAAQLGGKDYAAARKEADTTKTETLTQKSLDRENIETFLEKPVDVQERKTTATANAVTYRVGRNDDDLIVMRTPNEIDAYTGVNDLFEKAKLLLAGLRGEKRAGHEVEFIVPEIDLEKAALIYALQGVKEWAGDRYKRKLKINNSVLRDLVNDEIREILKRKRELRKIVQATSINQETGERTCNYVDHITQQSVAYDETIHNPEAAKLEYKLEKLFRKYDNLVVQTNAYALAIIGMPNAGMRTRLLDRKRKKGEIIILDEKRKQRRERKLDFRFILKED